MSVSNNWVVDASVALKWYFRDEEFLTEADSLLEAFSLGAATLVAPSYIRYEVANSLVVASHQGRLSHEQLDDRFQSFLALGISQPFDNEDDIRSAVEWTTHVSVAFYDALYLAVAHRLAYYFVTADKRLHERVEAELPWVIWIGNLETKA